MLSLCLNVANAQTTYHVYYLGGQSNMDGFGYVNELPEALQSPVEGVMVFHGNMAPDNVDVDGRGIWEELKPGHGTGFKSDGEVNSYSNRFGLELTFARTMKEANPDQNIALVIYSRGGTSIDTLAAGNFGAWDPDFVGENGVNQYDHFLATINRAFGQDDIDGDGEKDELVPAGILWMQGESDASHGVDIALRYQSHLKRMMDLFRAALRAEDLPVVIGRISDSGQDDDGRRWDHGNIVRTAQAAYVRSDPHAALVTSTDKYGYSDPWHYDSAGYIDLGREFAKAMLSLQ